MAKSYRVAVVGKIIWHVDIASYCAMVPSLKLLLIIGNLDESQGFFQFEYGLQVFDLSTDQICRLMEKPNIEGTE